MKILQSRILYALINNKCLHIVQDQMLVNVKDLFMDLYISSIFMSSSVRFYFESMTKEMTFISEFNYYKGLQKFKNNAFLMRIRSFYFTLKYL